MTQPNGGKLCVGDELTGEMIVTAAEASEFARLSGDPNPLHHDPEAAAASRFGEIIISGPQLMSRLMGLLPTELGRRGMPSLGLEFTFRFARAGRIDQRLRLRWEVVSVEYKESLHGDFAILEGTITDPEGAVVVQATSKMLLTDRL